MRLSQFTLTKLVIITPYYILVNETKVSVFVTGMARGAFHNAFLLCCESSVYCILSHSQHFLQVREVGNKEISTSIPPGEVCMYIIVCDVFFFSMRPLPCTILHYLLSYSAGGSFLAAARW